MEKTLQIKISVDKKTGAIKVVDEEFAKLSHTVNKTDKDVDGFTKKLENIAKAGAGLYVLKQAFDAVVKTGFEFNKNMENSIAGLSALTVATSGNTSALGKHLSISEKYNLAQQEAIKTSIELQKINSQTPHSLEQTNQIYKAMYVSMKNVGATNEQMIELTKKISIAAGAAGVEFNSLLAGVDGLATGTVLANSDLGRFLSSLGLTNDTLKNSSNVTELLLSKLDGFKALDTMTVAVSNFDNAWQQLTATLTKDIFDVTKEGIKSSTSWLEEYTGQVHAFLIQFKDVSDLESYKDLQIKLIQLQRDLNETQSKNTTFWWNKDKKAHADKIESLKKEIALIKDKTDALSHQDKLVKETKTWNELLKNINPEAYNGLNKMSMNILNEYEKNNQKIVQDNINLKQSLKDKLASFDPYENLINKYNKYVKQAKGNTDSLLLAQQIYDKELSRLNEKEIQNFNNKESKKSKTLTTSLSDWEDYFVKIGNYENAWLLEESKLREKYADLSEEEFAKISKIAKEEFFDKFQEQTKETADFWESMSSSLYESIDNSFFKKMDDSLDSLYSKFGMFSGVAKTFANPFLNMASDTLTSGVGSVFGITQNNMASELKDLGLTLKDGNWSGSVNGTDVKVSSTGEVLQGKSAIPTATLSTLSSAKTAYTAITNPASMLLAPSYYMGQGAGLAYGYGLTGTGNFMAGSANALSGSSIYGVNGSSLQGAALYGHLATAGLLGGVGGYLLGGLGDKLLGANTYAGAAGASGGALGAIVGSIVPGIGTLVGGAIGAVLGSVIGGLFGKTSVTGTATGIDIFGNATSNSVSGQDWGRTDYHKKSWFSSKSWSDWKYAGFTDEEKSAISGVIGAYDYLLGQMDIARELSVDGGRFSSIQQFLDTNVTKAFIEATGNDQAIYDIWVKYAKDVDKQIYEAFASQINQFITDKRSFTEYALTNNEDTIGALSYKADYLTKDLQTLQNTLGATGITVDNFAQKFDAAFKQNLTPQTLQDWENLGNALKSATDAANALRDATLAQYTNESKYKEYMLSLDNQILTSVSNFKLSLLGAFESLKQNVTSFMDNWHSSGYSTDASFSFYADRYSTLKKELSGYIALGDTASAQNTLNSLESVANNLKNSAIASGDSAKVSGVLSSVENDMQGFYSSFDTSAEAMKVIISGEDASVGLAKDGSLKGLTDAINKYNDAINAQFGVSTSLSLDSFYTDSSLMQQGDIKAFAEILQPKTLDELNKWIGILGNVRWDGLDYVQNLDLTTQDKLVELMDKIGITNDTIDSYVAKQDKIDYITKFQYQDLTQQQQSDLLSYVGGYTRDGGMANWDMAGALSAAFNNGATSLYDAAQMIDSVTGNYWDVIAPVSQAMDSKYGVTYSSRSSYNGTPNSNFTDWTAYKADWDKYYKQYVGDVNQNLLFEASWLHTNNGGNQATDEVQRWINNASLPSYDVGSSYIQYDQIAKIHEGERILTAEENKDFSTRFSNPQTTNINELVAVIVKLHETIKETHKTIEDMSEKILEIETVISRNEHPYGGIITRAAS